MLGSFFEHEKIKTTEAKAKELSPKIDRVLVMAKKLSDERRKLSVLRTLSSRLPKNAIKKLSDEAFRKRFENRQSGFSRIVKLPRRKSDSAKMAVIELID
jgi:large subunit ribosomal protein L17